MRIRALWGQWKSIARKSGKGSRFLLFTDYAKLFNNEARVGELDSDDIGFLWHRLSFLQ